MGGDLHTLSYCQTPIHCGELANLLCHLDILPKVLSNGEVAKPTISTSCQHFIGVLANWQCQSSANAFRSASVTSRSIFSFCRSVSVPLPDLFLGSMDTLSFPPKIALKPNDSAILVTVCGCSRPDSPL